GGAGSRFRRSSTPPHAGISRSHAASRVISRNTNRRHMNRDHDGRRAGRATLLGRAGDGILGTHRIGTLVRWPRAGLKSPALPAVSPCPARPGPAGWWVLAAPPQVRWRPRPPRCGAGRPVPEGAATMEKHSRLPAVAARRRAFL